MNKVQGREARDSTGCGLVAQGIRQRLRAHRDRDLFLNYYSGAENEKKGKEKKTKKKEKK